LHLDETLESKSTVVSVMTLELAFTVLQFIISYLFFIRIEKEVGFAVLIVVMTNLTH